MAERRMFAKTIIDSDAFLDMPLSTQALYFHLSMRADDDGFLNNPNKIMRMIGANINELEILVGKKFILTFETGVIVIKHWKIHNYIRNDRYKETIYTAEKGFLIEKNNKSYTLNDTVGIPLVDQMETQVRLGKVRLGKVNKDIDDFFQKMWSQYPNKKGKGQLKESAKKKCFEIGEEFERCIKRYITYVKKRQETDFADLKFQNGSTFFNTGYIDYLDSNFQEYIPEKPKQKSKTTTFNNYNQRDYDYDELEKKSQEMMRKQAGGI